MAAAQHSPGFDRSDDLYGFAVDHNYISASANEKKFLITREGR